MVDSLYLAKSHHDISVIDALTVDLLLHAAEEYDEESSFDKHGYSNSYHGHLERVDLILHIAQFVSFDKQAEFIAHVKTMYKEPMDTEVENETDEEDD